jgi:hypothetical protein
MDGNDAFQAAGRIVKHMNALMGVE